MGIKIDIKEDGGLTLEGSFHDLSFGHLLIWLLDEQRTGNLQLYEEGQEHRVAFEEGQPVGVRLATPDDVLGAILLEMGLISQEDFHQSLEEMSHSIELQGEILLRLGALQEEELQAGLQRQLRRKLNRIFRLPPKTLFHFDTSPDPAFADLSPGEVNVYGVIAHGIKNTYDQKRLQEFLQGLEQTALRLKPLEERKISFSDLDLEEEEMEAAALLRRWNLPHLFQEQSKLSSTRSLMLLAIFRLADLLELDESKERVETVVFAANQLVLKRKQEEERYRREAQKLRQQEEQEVSSLSSGTPPPATTSPSQALRRTPSQPIDTVPRQPLRRTPSQPIDTVPRPPSRLTPQRPQPVVSSSEEESQSGGAVLVGAPAEGSSDEIEQALDFLVAEEPERASSSSEVIAVGAEEESAPAIAVGAPTPTPAPSSPSTPSPASPPSSTPAVLSPASPKSSPSSTPSSLEDEEEEELSPEILAQKKLIEEKIASSEQTDFYSLLEIKRTATVREIQHAYRNLSRSFHPDRVAGTPLGRYKKELALLFSRINEAKSVLTDENRRKEYDEQLADPERFEQFKERCVTAASTELYYNKARVFLKKKMYARAEQEMAQAIEMLSDEGDYLAIYAWAIFNNPERPKEEAIKLARDHLKKALEFEGSPDMTHYYLGRVEKEGGALEEAMKHFESALQANPKHLEATRELRYLRMTLEKQQQKKKTGLRDLFKKKEPPKRRR